MSSLVPAAKKWRRLRRRLHECLLQEVLQQLPAAGATPAVPETAAAALAQSATAAVSRPAAVAVSFASTVTIATARRGRIRLRRPPQAPADDRLLVG